MSQTWVYLSTNRLDYTLKNTENGAGQTGAMVTASLLDGPLPTSPPVPGVSWPVNVPEVGNGLYRYIPPPQLLIAGRTYYAVGHAVVSGAEAHNEVTVTCQRDTT